MTRLRADMWSAAFARRHNDLGNMCVIARRGDPSAGQIWIEVDHLNGSKSLFTPASSIDSAQSSAGRLFECRYDYVEPQKVYDRIAKEIEFDPDLWVIAVEMRGDAHGLELVAPK